MGLDAGVYKNLGNLSEELRKQVRLDDAETGPNASLRMRPDGVAVLTIDEFEDTAGTKALLANMPAVAHANGLVIDLRANGGRRHSC